MEQSAEAQRRAKARSEEAAKLEGAVRSELEAAKATRGGAGGAVGMAFQHVEKPRPVGYGKIMKNTGTQKTQDLRTTIQLAVLYGFQLRQQNH